MPDILVVDGEKRLPLDRAARSCERVRYLARRATTPTHLQLPPDLRSRT